MTDTRRRPFRSPRIPIALAALSFVLWFWRFAWEWADLPLAPMFAFGVIGTVGFFVCWGAIFVWFFGSTFFSLRGKAVGAALLVVAGAAAAACVREVSLSGELVPTFRFRWQPPPTAIADDGPAPSDLPPIDLKIDAVRDFPRYRGLNADGVVLPVELLEWKWAEKDRYPKQLWRHACDRGFAGFAVAGNVAVTVEQRGDRETVVCYDLDTGRERWACGYDAKFAHPTGGGPRATPTITLGGNVLSLGSTGDLMCIDGKAGELLWRRNVLEDNSARRVEWGMTSSPLVLEAERLVVVNAGIDPAKNAGKALAAYDLRDGSPKWAAGSHGAGYSSAMSAALAGRRQVLIFDAGGLAGHDVSTGRELWRHPWKTTQDMNIIQPVLCGDDRVFISSETSNGGAMLKVTRKGDDFAAEVVWENTVLAAQYSNVVKLGKSLYGLSSGRLVCVDVETGKRNWRASRSYGRGQILAVGGSLLVQTEAGELVSVAADPKKFEERGRVKVFQADRNWNTPAVAGGRLYARNEFEMACYELPVQE